MKKLITLTLFLLGAAVVNAQIPGYLGKKLSLGINANFAPAGIGKILFPTYDIKYHSTIPLFNISMLADLDLAVSRRSSIGFRYDYAATNVDVRNYVSTIEDFSPLNFKTHTVLFKWNRHKKRDELPAPVGLMRGWSAGVSIVNVYDVRGEFVNDAGTKAKGKYTTTIIPQLMYSFTYRNVLYKRLMLTTGINIGVLAALIGLGDENLSASDSGSEEQGMKNFAMRRVYKQSVITANIGLSYILF